jgi:hypothetical protein
MDRSLWLEVLMMYGWIDRSMSVVYVVVCGAFLSYVPPKDIHDE